VQLVWSTVGPVSEEIHRQAAVWDGRPAWAAEAAAREALPFRAESEAVPDALSRDVALKVELPGVSLRVSVPVELEGIPLPRGWSVYEGRGLPLFPPGDLDDR
jgi:hypothetical protein